jgi:hypothetical protein
MSAAVEAVAVLASPGVLYAVLRLRGMGPVQLADPTMHTTFIVDPYDIFTRYQALFTPTSRLREAARVGFLVPARLSYLLFGAVPGFLAFRYVLALIAIGPLYLLLKKLYGRWAGFVGIAVVMSSAVVITAWGTDYPDSAAVSYLTGGLAALALSFGGRWRLGWLAAASGLLTMAVWSHGVSLPLVVVLAVVYVGVRLRRGRTDLGRDVALIVVSGVAVTGVLAVCSKLLLGQFDFITPTLKSATFLSSASERAFAHSPSWSWAPYDTYLLVPPAILVAYVVAVGRKGRHVGTEQLFVGLVAGLQLAAFAYLQFVGSLQTLEMHFFSSALWSSVNVVLALTVVEVARPFVELGSAERSAVSTSERQADRPVDIARWAAGAVPALLVLAAALAYEAADKFGLHVPPMTWGHGGAIVASALVAGAVVGRLIMELTQPMGARRGTVWLGLGSAGAVIVITGAALILTVAPPTRHGRLRNTVYDPAPVYSRALGGNDTAYVDEYKVSSELPGFVGDPAYRGQLLLTWEPPGQFGDLLGPIGMYHNAITFVSGSFPRLDDEGAHKIANWRASQVLLMSLTGRHFAQAVRSLTRFRPVVVRRAVLSDGSYHLHLWLVDLRRELRRP